MLMFPITFVLGALSFRPATRTRCFCLVKCILAKCAWQMILPRPSFRSFTWLLWSHQHRHSIILRSLARTADKDVTLTEKVGYKIYICWKKI